MASDDKIMVAAIDFGTTYSGWGLSFISEYQKDPTKVHLSNWNAGTFITSKTPTTLLINPDGKTLDAFGYDAEDRYAELASGEENEHSKWYYFRNFKMMLHEKMSFHRNVHLEDETNKTLPAKTVFSLAIKYLKDNMLELLTKKLGSKSVEEVYITWILTVPAIWNDSAKQFMREAADEAGIASERLSIALEPEAASVCIRLLPIDQMVEGCGMESFKPGSRYMVLDAGGGTVDIAVHEVTSGGQLKELHTVSGGAWGATQVDEAFKQFIVSVVGEHVFKRFQRECKEDHLYLMRHFEIKKRKISPTKNQKVTIDIAGSLIRIYKEETGIDLCDAIKLTKYADKLSLSEFKLRIDASIMRSFFSKPIQRIVSHVKELMQDTHVKGVQSIVMVGGFSESEMLQYEIKSHCPDVKYIIPYEASLIVLRGSVIFGHKPTTIAQRVCRYTYGTDLAVPFDIEKHDIRNRKEYANKPYCVNIFDKYVEVGQTVELNEPSLEKSYVPISENQTSIKFAIYASKQTSPMYVTDEGCTKIGNLIIDIRDKSVPMEERLFLFSMTFGGTEIQVKAREASTGNHVEDIVEARVTFLE